MADCCLLAKRHGETRFSGAAVLQAAAHGDLL